MTGDIPVAPADCGTEFSEELEYTFEVSLGGGCSGALTNTVTSVCAAEACPCSFGVGVSEFTCNDNETLYDPIDDTGDITFVVMSNGSSWTSDVAIGGVTTGADGMLLTETGVAAGTVITVVFTSDDDPDCTFTLDYTVPDCAVQIPTLSQWGLVSLALLLMIVGSLKLGVVAEFDEANGNG